jgi:glycosyltransferase involved in cell wall biosynthesis
MTVLVLMPIATKRGGAEQLLQRLLRCEAAPDVRWVVVFLEEGSLRDAFDQDGIETYVVEAGRLREVHRYVWAVSRVATLAGALGADLIFSWMPKAHFYGGVAAAWADCPAVWYQHGAPELDWRDQLLTLLPARSVLCCSRHVAEMQAELRPHRDIRVVHPCVDRSKFDPDSLPSPKEARRELNLPTEGPLVGTVGRLQQWKGIHTFVDALSCVLDSHSDVHGVIVGGRHPLEPKYDAHIDRRIADRGLQDRIFKVGFQSNVPMWMQAMDVVVHASNAEPFGMVIIEAMALGKPIVAGADGGPKEIITEGKTGLTAPFGQHEALARRLLYLLEHPVEAQRMGQSARDRAAEFSAPDFADQLISTLRSLVASSSA